MKCSAFIAVSADGYIATLDGEVEWLESAGNPQTGDGEQLGSGGWKKYQALILRRNNGRMGSCAFLCSVNLSLQRRKILQIESKCIREKFRLSLMGSQLRGMSTPISMEAAQ